LATPSLLFFSLWPFFTLFKVGFVVSIGTLFVTELLGFYLFYRKKPFLAFAYLIGVILSNLVEFVH
jgi:hypothetical protein